MTGTLRTHTGPHTTIEAPPNGQLIQLHGMGKVQAVLCCAVLCCAMLCCVMP